MTAIDLKLGAERIARTEQTAKDMLRLLLKNIDQDVLQIKTAYTQQNWETMRAALHKILGGLSYCGAPDLEQSCLHLQNALKNNDQRIDTFFQRFLSEIDILKSTWNSLGPVAN